MNILLLNGLVVVPAAFALLAALASRRERVAVGIALVGALATFGWSLWLVVGLEAYGGGLGDPDRSVDAVWLAALGVHWRLGVDGISGPLILMSTLVFATALFSLLRHAPDDAEGGPRRTGSLAVLLLVIEAGVLGSFLALDMVLFFVFFEVALIPMWFVINSWGDAHDAAARRRAATRFLVFTVTGSALMLVGFLLVRSEAGTFDIAQVAASYTPSGATAVAASLLVGLGLAVKTPLWPLHIWLPDAHSKAPTVGSVVLAAVLLKLGTYGFLRFWMPVTSPDWIVVPVVAALAVVGIVYGALACLAQSDLKRLIAYSSVGHMGFVVLGAATFTVGGVQAAVFASVAHGLITGLLFYLAGAIKDRYGTTDLARLRLLYGRVPRLAGLFAFAAMASLGLPGLAGFWGEMLAIRAAVDQAGALPEVTYRWLAFVAALGVILTSAYFLAVMRSMLQGPAVFGTLGREWAPGLLADAAAAPVGAGAGPAALRGDVPPSNQPRSSVARQPDPSTAGGTPPLRAASPTDAGSGSGSGGGLFGDGGAEAVATLPTDRVSADRLEGRGPDVAASEWVTWGPLVVLTLVLGVAPGYVLTPVAEAARSFLGGLG